ncbi:Uma2 family endonuclease [Catenuloplanes nepalensis]|uniref:Uma2 family endonuclease n=1 Tax=Catenuloplanes nepalensis TaxID=587533 RepID=A0ABT9N767_9ACTN|nr:Uma2 family endonuclease [Catenuloplanes nepalensis]MDP9799101.1 Uma2 family endonuclease [Catenuloplanes nepalensis]
MTAALNDDFSAQGLGLTVDDLERFPEDGVRRELIDGLLLVCPAPSRAHQKIASYLERTLEETCPEHLEVVQGVEIRLGPRRTFIPDVLVITADAAQHRSRMYEPHEIALAVEIVSPTSMAIDRVLKPNLYAEAGIPHYWRIEIEDGKILILTHALDLVGSYRETGRHADQLKIDEPWSIDIPVSRLMPRFF